MKFMSNDSEALSGVSQVVDEIHWRTSSSVGRTACSYAARNPSRLDHNAVTGPALTQDAGVGSRFAL